jgi:hypothetical protein
MDLSPSGLQAPLPRRTSAQAERPNPEVETTLKEEKKKRVLRTKKVGALLGSYRF